LFVYRSNAAKVPSVSGLVVPPHVTSRRQYEAEVLQPIYDDLAPLDVEGLLRYEWVNARGAIARFDRMAVEIRVLDSQECAKADLVVAQAVVAVIEQRYADPEIVTQSARWNEQRLAEVLWSVAQDGDRAVIDDAESWRCGGSRPRHSVRLRFGNTYSARCQLRPRAWTPRCL
jgi:hypothetical protein